MVLGSTTLDSSSKSKSLKLSFLGATVSAALISGFVLVNPTGGVVSIASIVSIVSIIFLSLFLSLLCSEMGCGCGLCVSDSRLRFRSGSDLASSGRLSISNISALSVVCDGTGCDTVDVLAASSIVTVVLGSTTLDSSSKSKSLKLSFLGARVLAAFVLFAV